MVHAAVKGLERKVRYYTLRGKIPWPCEDVLVWGRWLERGERVVKQQYVGQYWVSTVFLGLDHNHFGDGPPLLFETMVFRPAGVRDHVRAHRVARRMGIDGPIAVPEHIEINQGYCVRSSTWELALDEHERAVGWVRENPRWKRVH